MIKGESLPISSTCFTDEVSFFTGPCHQAGSDSLLTCATFRKLKEGFFNGSTDKYAGVLYGLGQDTETVS